MPTHVQESIGAAGAARTPGCVIFVGSGPILEEDSLFKFTASTDTLLVDGIVDRQRIQAVAIHDQTFPVAEFYIKDEASVVFTPIVSILAGPGERGFITLSGPAGQSQGSGINFFAEAATYYGTLGMDGFGDLLLRNTSPTNGAIFLDYTSGGLFIRNVSTSVFLIENYGSGKLVEIISDSASKKALVIKGASSQTGNLLELRDSSDNILTFAASNGDLTASKLTVNTGATLNNSGGDNDTIIKSADCDTMFVVDAGANLVYAQSHNVDHSFFQILDFGGAAMMAVGSGSGGFSNNNGIVAFNFSGLNCDFLIKGGTDDNLFYIDGGNDAVTFGSQTELAKVGIDGTQDEKQFVIQAHSSQTQNLQEFQDSAGNALTSFDKTGAWNPPSMADSAAANNSVYYSTTASKLVYKDSGGSVNQLY